MRALALKAVALLLLLTSALPARAQPTAEPPGMILLTVFLKHDQSKTLAVINEELRVNGWYKNFPPPGVEIVSFYVVMGIGQIVTLRLPAEKLREVNRVLEVSGWGAYRTEFYPTYDYRQAWEDQKKLMNAKP